MGYRVGQYLKSKEDYVAGVDPVAETIQNLPNILAENQRYAVAKREESIKNRDKAAKEIMDNALTGLTVQTDKEGPEYQQAMDALSYFDEFYKDDPVMLSYGNIYKSRMERFDARQATYEGNINEINTAHADIKSKLGTAYQTDELEELLTGMKDAYYQSEQEFTKGEQSQYTNMINELDTAIETYRGLWANAAEGLRPAEGTEPQQLIDDESAKEYGYYQAAPSLANDDEYQATLDQSWAAIQNGDYAQAQKLFNTAQANKIEAEGQYGDIRRGIDSYYIDNPNFDESKPESEINPKVIMNPDISSIQYDIDGIETGAKDLLLSAEQMLSADDLDGAQRALRRIPKSAADSQRRALIAIEKDVGRQKNVVDEMYDNILGDIQGKVDGKDYDDEVENLLKELKQTGKIDGSAGKTGLFALPQRQAKTRETIIDLIKNGSDWTRFLQEDVIDNKEVRELFRQIDMMDNSTVSGKWNDDLGEWDQKPKEMIADDIFKWLSEDDNAKEAFEWLDWSGRWLDNDENKEMAELLEQLVEVEAFSRPLSERADRYNNEVLRYATGR